MTAHKYLLSVLAVAVLAALPERSLALPINAVAQPSFEFDDSSWVTSNAFASFCPSSLGGNTGPCWGLMGGSGSLSQILLAPVPGSQVTQLQMYATVWSPSSQPTATLEVTIGYQTGPSTFTQQIVESVDQWVLFDFTSAVDPSRVMTSIELHHLNPGYLGVDDVSLIYEPIPEPATIVLLGLGLLGMAWTHRSHRPTRRCN